MARVLVVDQGARGHALCWKFKQDGHEVFCTPGNAGTRQIAHGVNGWSNYQELAKKAKALKIDLTIPGSETYLASGLVDMFDSYGLRIFGPSKHRAVVETSKAYTKELAAAANIPVPRNKIFGRGQLEAALIWAMELGLPVVAKPDGLAGGKAVTTCQTLQQLREILSPTLLKTRELVGIEEFLTANNEISLTAICSLRRWPNNFRPYYLPLLATQDHKQIGDNDTGPNTGGMGAYGPVPFVREAFLASLYQTFISNFLQALADQRQSYLGFLYPNIMLTSSGPVLLEQNARLGDPETQVLMPLLQSDLVSTLIKVYEGETANLSLCWNSQYAACVVLASKGYGYSDQVMDLGNVIEGVDEAQKTALVFQAGTDRNNDGHLINTEGRVLSIVGRGETLEAAIGQAYQAAAKINFKGMYYRRDIGQKGLRLKEYRSQEPQII